MHFSAVGQYGVQWTDQAQGPEEERRQTKNAAQNQEHARCGASFAVGTVRQKIKEENWADTHHHVGSPSADFKQSDTS